MKISSLKVRLVLVGVTFIPLGPVSAKAQDNNAAFSIIDGTGRKLEFERIPSKIIPLQPPGIPEIVFKLGAGDKVVGIQVWNRPGVSSHCKIPADVYERLPKVGKPPMINIEAVVGLGTEAVFVMDRFVERMAPLLEPKGVKVVGLRMNDYPDLLDSIMLVGKALGKEKEASNLVSKIREKVEGVEARLKGLRHEDKPRVLYVLPRPCVAGGKGIINDMIERAGGLNIYGDVPMLTAPLNSESIMERDPDIIIFYRKGVGELEALQNTRGWKTIKAVKNDRIHYSDSYYTKWGPTAADAIEQFAKWFHPDLMRD